MAHDPFTAHLELAEATKDAIHACERYFLTREGEMPSPEAMAMLQAVGRLRATHEQFGRFAGGIVLAHQALAEAYQIAPAAVPVMVPPGAPTPWLDRNDEDDEDGGGEGPDEEAPPRALAAPRAEALSLAVPASVVNLDQLSLAATEVSGIDGTLFSLLVGHWNEEAQNGARLFHLTPAEQALLTKLSLAIPMLRAIVGAIAGVMEVYHATLAPSGPADAAVVMAVHPGHVERASETPPSEGLVYLGTVEAVDALASLPEFRAAQRIAPRDVLVRVVDAVRAAVGSALVPVTVRVAEPYASILASALAALRDAQVDVQVVGPLLDHVRVTPAP